MKHFEYVWHLIKFSFRANPLFYASIAIALISVVIELLAMSSLLPLFEVVSGGVPASDGLITRALVMFGFAVNTGAILWVFIILFVLRILTQIIGQSLTIYLGRRVMAQLGSQAFTQVIQKIEIWKVNKESMGFYIGLAGDESFRASSVVMSVTQFISTAALALLYFAAIAKFSPLTAGIILVFAICLLLVLYKVAKLSHRLGGLQTEGSRQASSVFLDALNNIKAVRAFSAEKYVVAMYRSLIFGYAKTLFLIDVLALLTKMLPVLLLLLIFSIGLLLSSHPIEGSGLAFVATMIVYLMRFFPTVGQGVNLLMKIASDAKSGKDVTAILGQGKNQSETNHQQSLGKISKIEINNVAFSYYKHEGHGVLKGISLKFEQCKSYALVGKSGLGKSTLIDLLLKFYLPTSGQIYFNNLPISEIADADIRNRVIVVNQEAAIFDDTVTNNICLGMDVSTKEVQQACVLAQIDGVIANMADGYNTRLQYQGKNLSGGQRQRIAIARALLRKPDVIIFDESTSALDKATQERVVSSILREYAEKIVIFVTHDPEIMRQVDEIIDLEVVNINAH